METTFHVGLHLFKHFGSYRTYEEWKHEDLVFKQLVNTGSYRTYEEWKHNTTGETKILAARFLPYL